jgi:hypothetical protein
MFAKKTCHVNEKLSMTAKSAPESVDLWRAQNEGHGRRRFFVFN